MGFHFHFNDLSKASGVGFKIYENRLPVIPEVNSLLEGDELLEAACLYWWRF